jgi:hypothetical protein
MVDKSGHDRFRTSSEPVMNGDGDPHHESGVTHHNRVRSYQILRGHDLTWAAPKTPHALVRPPVLRATEPGRGENHGPLAKTRPARKDT